MRLWDVRGIVNTHVVVYTLCINSARGQVGTWSLEAAALHVTPLSSKVITTTTHSVFSPSSVKLIQ